MASADKLQIVTSKFGKGEAGKGELWYVNIAGQGKKNYNEDGFEYTATLRVKKDSELATNLKKAIEDFYNENHGGNTKLKCRSLGFRDVMTKDEDGNGVETDFIDFQFKTKTTFVNKKTGKEENARIKVFNSNAQEVSLGSKKVGNGTIGAISGQAGYYSDNKKEDGVSLYLNNIQIFKFIEYVSNGGFSKAEGDFDGVEDSDSGFVGSEAAPESAEEPKAAKPRL